VADENPYAPSAHDIVDRGALEEQLPWFVVGATKLRMLNFFTVGLYGAYWFHQQYRRQERLRREGTSPLLRGLLFPFYAFELFERARVQARHRGVACTWSARLLATALLALVVVFWIRGYLPVSSALPSRAWTIAVSTVVAALVVLGIGELLVTVQRTIVAMLDHDRLSYDANAGLTGAGWSLVIGGGLVWIGLLTGAITFGVHGGVSDRPPPAVERALRRTSSP
jgi:hypothetical protein